ncbi:enoyl-CoA hydratase-related protein [Actinophytocola sp.]|uniref:enoyl-CoA hydratase-related protein n=1 Tax=Actinophytocola sp. TaxID=1872138 RepID=UPI003D6A4841
MTVSIERLDGGIAVITIERERSGNSIDGHTGHGLNTALSELEAEVSIRGAVITGAGDRYFCTGMDLKEFGRGNTRGIVSSKNGFAGIARRKTRLLLAAAVNGLALGGGFEIVLACDLAVASEQARFSLPEVKRGLIAAGGGLVRLPRTLPPKIVTELALTGNEIGAERALSLGLVNSVVAPGEEVPAAITLLRAVLANAPAAVAASRDLIRQTPYLDEEEAWLECRRQLKEVLAAGEAREGADGFTRGVAPTWPAAVDGAEA